MKKDWQIVLAGEGGQGLIVAGRIMSEASIMDGNQVALTSSYGIAARGGYSEAQVVTSNKEVHYPKCETPDLVLALTSEAYRRYADKISEDGLIIYDAEEVKGAEAEKTAGKNEIAYPFKDVLIELGDMRVINSLFLGVILKNRSIVSQESLQKALEKNLPSKVIDLNLKAFKHGLEQ